MSHEALASLQKPSRVSGPLSAAWAVAFVFGQSRGASWASRALVLLRGHSPTPPASPKALGSGSSLRSPAPFLRPAPPGTGSPGPCATLCPSSPGLRRSLSAPRSPHVHRGPEMRPSWHRHGGAGQRGGPAWRLGVSGRWLRARAAGQAQCGGSRAWGPPHSTRATRGTEGHRAAPLQRPPRLLLGRGCAHGRGAHAVTVGTPGLRGTAEAVSTRGHGRFAPRPQGVGLAARPRRARGAAALCRTPAAPPAPGSQPRRDPRGGLRGPPTASPSPPRSAGGVLAPHQITARKPVEEKRATAATAAPGPGCFPQLPLPPEPPPGPCSPARS